MLPFTFTDDPERNIDAAETLFAAYVAAYGDSTCTCCTPALIAIGHLDWMLGKFCPDSLIDGPIPPAEELIPQLLAIIADWWPA